jgi:purine-binding chemotaxis protein CheW
METLATGTATAAGHTSGGKFLTFTLGNEEYGVPVLKVREIIKVMDITQVPPHVLGVIQPAGAR